MRGCSRRHRVACFALLSTLCCFTNATCPSGTLEELDGAFGEVLAVYGDRKVYLSNEARRLPEDEVFCRQIDRFKVAGGSEAVTSLLFDECSKKCKEKDVAILAGSGTRGLNLQRAVDVCFGAVSVLTRDKEEACTKGTEALHEVEKATEAVVAKLAQVQLAGLSKKTQVMQLTKQARDLVLSEAYRQAVEVATVSQIEETFLEFYSGILQAFVAKPEDAYVASMADLKQAFEELETSFSTNFLTFVDALDSCNTMVPKTGFDDAIIYDLCAVSKSACFEEDESNHVSCCCTGNPMAALPGLSKAGNDIGKSTFFDICSESRRSTTEWAALKNIEESISKSVFSQFVDKMKQEHGDYFRPPETEANAQGDANRGAPSEFPSKVVTDCGADRAISRLNINQASLPNSLKDKSTNYQKLKVVSDFSGRVNENHCSSNANTESEPFDAGKVFGRCEEFCGGTAVPLLMGTPSSPVSLKQILPVCFGDSVVGDSELNDFCRGPGGATALANIQVSMAEFVAELMLFRITQILFLTSITKGAETVKMASESDEFKSRIQSQSNVDQLVAAYVDHYTEKFKTLADAEEELVEAGNRLKAKFNELKILFDDELQNLNRYATECSSKLLPRVAGDQAVLAICPVLGELCQHESPDDPTASGSYMYCCCAENAMLAESESIDVCSAAKVLAADRYEAVVNDILEREGPRSRRIGTEAQKSFYLAFLDGMWERYGKAFDPPVEDARKVVEFVAEAPRFSITLKRITLTDTPYDNEFLIGGEDDTQIELACTSVQVDDKTIVFRETYLKEEFYDVTTDNVIVCNSGDDLVFNLVEYDIFSDDTMEVKIDFKEYALMPLGTTIDYYVEVEGNTQLCLTDLDGLGVDVGGLTTPCSACSLDIGVRTLNAPASKRSHEALTALGIAPFDGAGGRSEYAVPVCPTQGKGEGIYRLTFQFEELPVPTSASSRSSAASVGGSWQGLLRLF